MKRLAIIIAGAALLVLGFSAASLATKPPPGNGNGGQPRGGDNPCPPSEHAVRDASGKVTGCEHNGDGGGNCGQNQSGKGDKNGNGGDKGYGHKPGCESGTTTTTQPSTTSTGRTTTAPSTTTTQPASTTSASSTTTPAPVVKPPAAKPPKAKPPTTPSGGEALPGHKPKVRMFHGKPHAIIRGSG